MWCSNSAIPVTRSYPNASHSGFDASRVQLVFGIIRSMASASRSSLSDGSFMMSAVRAQCQHNEMLPSRHTLSVKATPTWDFARAGRCYGRSRSAPTLSVAAIAGSALRRRVLLSFLAEWRSASEVFDENQRAHRYEPYKDIFIAFRSHRSARRLQVQLGNCWRGSEQAGSAFSW